MDNEDQSAKLLNKNRKNKIYNVTLQLKCDCE